MERQLYQISKHSLNLVLYDQLPQTTCPSQQTSNIGQSPFFQTMIFKLRLTLPCLIIISLKILRNVGYGIFSCIFYEFLFQKTFTEPTVLKIAISSLIGSTVLLGLVPKMNKTEKNNLVILAYLVKIITGLAFRFSESSEVIIGISIFGLLPVTGGENVFLGKEEEELVIQQVGNFYSPHQVRKYLPSLSHLGRTIGCTFTYFFLKHQHNQCNSLDLSLPFLANLYCLFSGLQFLLSLLVKRKEVEDEGHTHQEETEKSPLKVALYGFSEACLLPIFLAFLYYERYILNLFHVCFILMGRNFLPMAGPLVRWISLKIFGKTITNFFYVVSNLLPFMMLFIHSRLLMGVGVAYIQVSVFLARFKVKLLDLHHHQRTYHPKIAIYTRKPGSYQAFWGSLGLLVGVLVNSYFQFQESYSILFVLPLAYSAGIKLCLDIESWTSRLVKGRSENVGVSEQQIELYNIPSPDKIVM